MTITEALSNLSAAIDQRADEIHDARNMVADTADAREVMRACGRLLRGHAITVAFGAPGDWGYSTLIGKALLDVHKCGGASIVLKVRPSGD